MTKLSKGNFKDFDKFKECRRLGIFDSGVGGLSILKYLNEYLDDKQMAINQNNKEIIYVADNGRFPYGTKSPDEILTYTKQIIRWLENQNVDLIVFGCNTASAIAGRQINDMTTLPVLDLVEPVAMYVSQLGLKVGILATEATVQSHAFLHAIKKYAPQLSVQEIASAQLVNIVESGEIASKETEELLSGYIDQFYLSGTQIIVLSCTHFSFLKDSLLHLLQLISKDSRDIRVLDPSQLIVKMLIPKTAHVNHLTNELISAHSAINTTFFVTGNAESFVRTAIKCLGYPIKNVNHLSLKNLESLAGP